MQILVANQMGFYNRMLYHIQIDNRYVLQLISRIVQVTISIYNVHGQRVRLFEQGQQSVGEHSVTWNATDERGKEVASGMKA